MATGIYYFDTGGRAVGYLNIRPRRFAISGDDRYIYADEDGAAVRIYLTNIQ